MANFTPQYNNTTASGYDYPEPPSLSQLIPLSIILIGAICTAIGGNAFIIYAFIRFPRLRTQFNTYIFNLSIADLFVGIIVMPSFFLYNCYGYWPFGEPMCSVWVFTDWFMTFESVLTLAVISAERLWSVTWPISYKTWHRTNQVRCTIVLTWLVVAAVWIPALVYDRVYHDNIVENCAWDPAKNFASGIYIGVLGYLLPFLLMCSCYAIVGWKVRTRSAPLRKMLAVEQDRTVTSVRQAITVHTNDKSLAPRKVLEDPEDNDLNEPKKRPLKKSSSSKPTTREGSALVTLGAIGFAFSVCWIPFYVYFFVTLFAWAQLPDWFLTLSYWLAYLNSAVNPVLYTALNEDMRKKAIEILCCRRKRVMPISNMTRININDAANAF
ncbi:muscarinic acetylcholine receptor M2-like [Paramacrobiotus metropolitanus]|uniref:muscarinic acetylcholine receptor M2-like n=1 Tax=Paramacrobiotus metropolitanus TaxID=2943436 RepID=UPI00244563A1|nr:muscarinic acetylcholine receptor M2-like [Paramacrobiotus metropolitanus]